MFAARIQRRIDDQGWHIAPVSIAFGDVFPWPECAFADTGYDARQTYGAAAANSVRLEIVRRNPEAVGFEVIERRWVVERIFSRFGRNRHLAEDFENLADTLLAFITLAAIQFGIRRLARR